MKIVVFQYNRELSAIIQQNTQAQAAPSTGNRPVVNRFLANGYEDRFLWEEAAAPQSKPRQKYVIPGNWQ